MNNEKKEILEKIISDKTSGSSEILTKFNKFLLSNVNQKDIIIDSLSSANAKLSHFAVINNYIYDLNKLIESDRYDRFIEYLTKKDKDDSLIIKKIFNKIYKKLQSAKSLLTFSKSGTVIGVLKIWFKEKKSLKIIVTESRPNNEGKLMTKELLKYGLKVEMITDAMAGLFVPKADAVIVGADAVLNNGNVINKSGSLSLALLCKHFGKPFYVLAAKSKFVNKKRYKIKEESPENIWRYKHLYLKTINIPFEEIDSGLITEIISE